MAGSHNPGIHGEPCRFLAEIHKGKGSDSAEPDVQAGLKQSGRLVRLAPSRVRAHEIIFIVNYSLEIVLMRKEVSSRRREEARSRIDMSHGGRAHSFGQSCRGWRIGHWPYDDARRGMGNRPGAIGSSGRSLGSAPT